MTWASTNANGTTGAPTVCVSAGRLRPVATELRRSTGRRAVRPVVAHGVDGVVAGAAVGGTARRRRCAAGSPASTPSKVRCSPSGRRGRSHLRAWPRFDRAAPAPIARATSAAKSAAVRPRSVSGSSRWASNPAEISSHVGAKRSTSGATNSSNARRYTSPVVPAGSGMFIVVPAPAPAPVSVRRPVPG